MGKKRVAEITGIAPYNDFADMPTRPHWIALFAGLAIALLVTVASDGTWFEDRALWLLGPSPRQVSDAVTVVALDPEVINTRYDAVTGRLDRRLYVDLLERLASTAPRAVVLDVLFRPGATSATTIGSHSAAGAMSSAPDGAESDARILQAMASFPGLIVANHFSLGARGVQFDRACFGGPCVASGYVNLPLEHRRVVRSFLPAIETGGSRFLHLAVAAVARAVENEEIRISSDRVTLINRSRTTPQLEIPVANDGHARIRFRGATYPTVRASSILAATDTAWLNAVAGNKIVIIGAMDERLGDRLLTPWHLLEPARTPSFGVEILANVIDNVLSNDVPRVLGAPWLMAAAIVLSILGAWAAGLGLPLSIVVAIGSSATLLVAGCWLFSLGAIVNPGPALAALWGALVVGRLLAQRSISIGESEVTLLRELLDSGRMQPALELVPAVGREGLPRDAALALATRFAEMQHPEAALALCERLRRHDPRDAHLIERCGYFKALALAAQQRPGVDSPSGIRAILPSRYTQVEPLGQGGMGRVYRAHDNLLDRPVAIKTLTAEGDDALAAQARFIREARLLAALNHPNIVRIYDVGEGPPPYICLELVEGQSLRVLIDSGGHTDLPRMRRLVDQLLGALEYLASRDILHRDLKPENILIGADDQLRLADFGLGHGTTDAHLTKTGMVVGTPHYLSPERLQGEGTDVASEIYCAAVVIYEMLCGQRPYPSDELVDIVMGRRIGLRERNVAIPEPLAAAVEAGLKLDRRDRPTSFAAWRELIIRAG